MMIKSSVSVSIFSTAAALVFLMAIPSVHALPSGVVAGTRGGKIGAHRNGAAADPSEPFESAMAYAESVITRALLEVEQMDGVMDALTFYHDDNDDEEEEEETATKNQPANGDDELLDDNASDKADDGTVHVDPNDAQDDNEQNGSPERRTKSNYRVGITLISSGTVMLIVGVLSMIVSLRYAKDGFRRKSGLEKDDSTDGGDSDSDSGSDIEKNEDLQVV